MLPRRTTRRTGEEIRAQAQSASTRRRARRQRLQGLPWEVRLVSSRRFNKDCTKDSEKGSLLLSMLPLHRESGPNRLTGRCPNGRYNRQGLEAKFTEPELCKDFGRSVHQWQGRLSTYGSFCPVIISPCVSMTHSQLFMAKCHRQIGAWLYRIATLQSRRRTFCALSMNGGMPIAILFYHRVADKFPNPWTISRRNFVQHLDWLTRNFDIVSLDEAQNRICSKTNTRPSVAITFDDGYAENCDFAIPELQRRQLTATYFVATHAVESGESFEHDLRHGQRLRPNSIGEIKDIARAGFAIGGHTQSHADLGATVTRDAIEEEIVGGLEKLKAWGVGPIRHFSFPFGLPRNMSQMAVDVIREAGFAGFCSSYGSWNWPASSGFHLRRIHADPGMQTLQNWLTLDPRKLNDKVALPFTEPGKTVDKITTLAVQ